MNAQSKADDTLRHRSTPPVVVASLCVLWVLIGQDSVFGQHSRHARPDRPTFQQSLTVEVDATTFPVHVASRSRGTVNAHSTGIGTTSSDSLELTGPSLNHSQRNPSPQQTVDSSEKRNTTLDWWSDLVGAPMLPISGSRPITLIETICIALENAPRIHVLHTDVGIAATEIARQRAAFDWISFLDTRWNDSAVPVGNDLTGAQNRFRDNQWTYSTGLRQKNLMGGQVGVTQELGHQNTNSQFFNPANQGTAGLRIEYTQPLLQGAGLAINRSVIEIAIVETEATQQQFLSGLQDYLFEVTAAYWDLVTKRAELVVLIRSADRAKAVSDMMSKRTDVDINPLQLTRAQATAAARRSQIVPAKYAVKQAQDQLLELVYGQAFLQFTHRELLPLDLPACGSATVNLTTQVELGLQNRPEVHESLLNIRAAALERGIAKNQLLPILGMTMDVSNQGLRGNSDIHRAWQDQFRVGEPSYSVGLNFEYPLGNRAARANLRQRELTMLRLQKEFETVIAALTLEIRNAGRNLTAAQGQLLVQQEATTLALRELNQINQRTKYLVDGDEVGRLYLNDLLQTQDRLAAAELALLRAQTNCMLSAFELERATGILLRHVDNSPTDYLWGGTTSELLPSMSTGRQDRDGWVRSEQGFPFPPTRNE